MFQCKISVFYSVPRGLNSHFRRLRVNDSLTSAIRASRAAQLLIMLYQLGQWKEGEDNCSPCSRRSPMAFCEQRQQQCISRITMTSSCSGFAGIDPCYASECVEGVCVQLQEPPASFSLEPPKKKIAERAVPMTTSTSTTTTSTPSTDIVARLLDLVDEEQLSDDDNSTLYQSNSTDALDSDSPAVQLMIDDQNRTNSEEEATETAIQKLPHATYITATTATTLSSTLAPPTNFRFDNPHFNRELLTWVYSFDDFLPYPTVYFSVMVIAGKYKPRPRPQRSAAGVTVFSRGENLPNGYTHIVEALPLDSGHVIRIPDPVATDILVEFSFIVRKMAKTVNVSVCIVDATCRVKELLCGSANIQHSLTMYTTIRLHVKSLTAYGKELVTSGDVRKTPSFLHVRLAYNNYLI
ncbi:hypothetical protein ANCCAN_25050, partial [Ancylostoma caninum]